MTRFGFICGLGFLALATSSAAQEREWVLDAAEEDVYLLFGVPNTTDVGVSFWCKISSGKVSLFAPAPTTQRKLKSVSLEIGKATFDLDAALSEDSRQVSLEAKLVPQGKILAELQSAERFTLTVGKHKSIYPLIDADFAGLLKFCNIKPEGTNN
jgi:hypothetical protein